MGLFSSVKKKLKRTGESVVRNLSNVSLTHLSAGSLLVGQPELAAFFGLGAAIKKSKGGDDSIVAIQSGRVNVSDVPPTTSSPNAPLPGSALSPSTDIAGSYTGGLDVANLIRLGSGINQQTASVRHMLAKAAGARGGRKSARRRAATRKPVARKKKRARANGGKFVKGSAAAKRHMAKLRRMRKK